VAISSGEEHDSKRFVEVMRDIKIKHGNGRPKRKPKEVHADSAYDTRKIRTYLRKRGIKANIPVNPRNRSKTKRGRPCKLDEESYKQVRSSVEKFFAWLKSFRRIVIRYERLRKTFKAPVLIACTLIHLRVLQ
jgi:transposase